MISQSHLSKCLKQSYSCLKEDFVSFVILMFSGKDYFFGTEVLLQLLLVNCRPWSLFILCAFLADFWVQSVNNLGERHLFHAKMIKYMSHDNVRDHKWNEIPSIVSHYNKDMKLNITMYLDEIQLSGLARLMGNGD